MPTKITDTNHSDGLQGSPEKRLDIAPDGTLWACIVSQGSPGKAKFFRSTNGGSTWTYASSSDVSLEQNSAVPSFFIDVDGYAHISWVKWDADPQVVRYARGVPTGSNGWSWTTLTISPAGGRTGVDSDVIVHRNGTGWTAWVSWDMRGGVGGAKVSQVSISSTGALSVATTQHGPLTGAEANQFGSLEWAHTGDGKTRSGDPHLFFTTAVQSVAGPLRVQKALYSAGTWTWQTPVVVSASVQIEETALCTVWDGSRLMVAYSAEAAATIFVAEWDGSAGSVTMRNPPAAPGGTGTTMGLSLAHDPETDDLYLAYYDETDGDIRWSKFTRATTSWSAWAVAVTRSVAAVGGSDGKVQLVRHPSRDSVDMIYANHTVAPTWEVYSQQLAALVRAPEPPTLVSPSSGALLDLAAGGTFEWTYNGVAPGDSQQAYAFRRIEGATTEYWNATTQTWSGSIVWNTSTVIDPTKVTFPAAKWTTGDTYLWSVATRSATGADSAFAPDRTVVATAAPVAVATAPLGVVYGESTPLVEWTYTSLDPQANYQVRVIEEQVGIDPDSTTPVWDSGVVTSAIARSVRVVTSLSDGVAYRAYVRVTSSAAATSAWSYTTFTISTEPPNGPLVELLDEVHWDTEVPRVRLDVTARSNFLSEEQDIGGAGWEADVNATVEAQAEDTGDQILAGIKIGTVAAGIMSVITELGDPPAAPYGQPQPLGPLSFPVVPGVTYTGLASFRAVGPDSRAVRVKIQWYDADDGTGSLISTSTGEMFTATDVAYVQAHMTDVAPVGAALARLVLEVVNATAGGEGFYVAHPDFHPGLSTTYGPGGYAANQTVRVERSVDGGTTWETVVDRLKPSLAQRATARDRLMPFGIDVKYRAYTDVDLNGSTLSSEASPVSTLALDVNAWVIRDPADENVEMLAYVVGHDRTDDEASSVHWPAGREFPIVDTEGVQAATGTLDIFVYGNQVDAATLVLRRAVPMVVQTPIGTVYNVRLIRRNYAIEQLRHRVIKVAYVEIDP